MTVFYSILFALLMFVDWSQNTMNGGIWAITVNCIGLLMCSLIFSLFSWKKCRKRYYVIWLTVWFIASAVIYAWWKTDIWHVLDGQFITGELNVGAMGVLLIRYFEDGIFKNAVKRRNRLDICVMLLWVLLTLWMCVSPQKSLWHLYYFSIFFLFYLAPAEEHQKRKIVDGVLNGVVIGFFVIQIFAYGFRPYEFTRYAGFYTNCNMNALMYLITYVVVLTRILYWDNQNKSNIRKWNLLFYYVLAGGLLGFQILTMTRTALIMDLAATAIFMWVLALRKYKERKDILRSVRGALARGLVIAGLMVVLFPVVFGTVRYLPTILHRPVRFIGEHANAKITSDDPWDSEKYVEWEEFWSKFSNKVLRDDDSGALKELSNGRIEIWRVYLKNMNCIGHSTKDGLLQITPDYYAWHAHNVFLQIGYIYGIPAAILFIVLAGVLGVRLMIRFLKNPYDQWTVFRGFIYLVFFGFGMLEITWNTGQMVLVLLFCTQKTLENKKQ